MNTEIAKELSADETLKDLVLRQEEAITELNDEIRRRDEIILEAINEAASLHRTLNECWLRMLRARWTRP
jgi:hypothetical protein